MASVVASKAAPPLSSWTSVGSSTPKTVSIQKTTSVSAALAAAKPQKHQSKGAAAHQMTNSRSTPKQQKISGLFKKVEGRAKLRL
eukprot:663460-Pleurochrysis_carterae.AAC.1